MRALSPLRLLSVLAFAFAAPAVASQPCPTTTYGPYPCALTTLVALADQAGPLGLSGAQLDDLQSLRDTYVREMHDVIGDIRSLQEAIHDLDRPLDALEAFALFYELGQHEADLEDTIRAGARAQVQGLTEPQREAWRALLVRAASLQESSVEAPPRSRVRAEGS